MAEVYYFWFVRVGLLPEWLVSGYILLIFRSMYFSLDILVFVVCFGGSIKIKSGHALP